MDDKSPAIALYCSLVRGSATKTKLRKSTRFTHEQEALMENCFSMTANTFGIAINTASVIIAEVCTAISKT